MPDSTAPPAPGGAPAHPARASGPTPAEGAPGVVVAVDGPSGSGKSTVCRTVAGRRGLAYLDTGAMYRALCWWCLEHGIALDDAAAVAAAARDLDLVVGTDPGAPTVSAGGVDVTTAVRASRISSAVSAVATNLAVRAEMVARQQAIIAAAAAGTGVVAEGRDITTVVAPDAPVRVLVTADEDARLARRARELHGSADAAALAATRDEVVRRDATDSTVAQFTTAADGVVTVDNSGPLEETVAALLALVDRAATARPAEHAATEPAGASA